jgi:hypothetical protein
VAEGGDTYLDEASVMHPAWQDSFYGSHYSKSSETKKKYDPRDVFYATMAISSDRWRVEVGEQGVQTQNGKRVRSEPATVHKGSPHCIAQLSNPMN